MVLMYYSVGLFVRYVNYLENISLSPLRKLKNHHKSGEDYLNLQFGVVINFHIYISGKKS